jgi:hypothetical protein
MLRWLSRRLSYANVTATLALFLALGGVSYAAVTLPANSVGSKQIKKSAVTLKKISPAARKALKGTTGVKGDPGAIGAQGPAGAAGPTGAAGHDGANGATTVVVRGASATIPANVYGHATAQCHAGERATGGGASIAGTHGQLTDSGPADGSPTTAPTGWFGQGKTDATADAINVTVVCASP